MSNLGKYQSRNPLKRVLLRRFLDRVHSLLPESSGQPILDVGAGEGLFWRENATAAVVGLDVRVDALMVANDNPHFTAVAASANSMPFTTGAFEHFVAIEILEHLLDPNPALKEISRVVSAGGLVSVPWEPWFSLMVLMGTGAHVRRLGREPEHVQAFGPSTLEELLSVYFAKVRVHRVFPWLLAEVSDPVSRVEGLAGLGHLA
ncbi:MAG: class I SAM-dependent methyltransferase [Acidimicrobiia bacterium]